MSETSDRRRGILWGCALGRGVHGGVTAIDSAQSAQPRARRAACLLLPLPLLVALFVGACASQPATPAPTVDPATIAVSFTNSYTGTHTPTVEWAHCVLDLLYGGGWVLTGGRSRVVRDGIEPNGYVVWQPSDSARPHVFALCLSPSSGVVQSGRTRLSNLDAISTGGPVYTKAPCLPGEVALAGGYDAQGLDSLSPSDASVFESAPEPNGWSVGAISHTGHSLNVQSWVYCASAHLHTVINSTTFTVPAGRGATGTATCADRRARLLSGGYSIAPQAQVDVTASAPVPPSALPANPVPYIERHGDVDQWAVRAVSHDTVDRVVTIAVVCGTPFTPPTPTPTRTPAPTPTSTLTPTPWPTPVLATLVPAPWVVISAPAGPLTTFTEVAPPEQQVHLSGSGSSYVTRFQWSDSINGGAEVPLGVGPDLDVVLLLASTANCAITDHQIWLAGSTSDGQVARYMIDVKLEATCVR